MVGETPSPARNGSPAGQGACIKQVHVWDEGRESGPIFHRSCSGVSLPLVPSPQNMREKRWSEFTGLAQGRNPNYGAPGEDWGVNWRP